jgi:hypothetical protein
MPKQALLETISVLCGAGAIGPVVVRQVFNTVRELISERARKKHLEGLRKISQIYEELNQIVASDQNVSRATIVRSSNSGGIPQPGCRIYIRALHESFKTLFDSVVHGNRWQERQADQHYITLVREIAESGGAETRTQDLPEDSTLRAIWDASKIHKGSLKRLKLSGTEMIYLEVLYREDLDQDAVAKAVFATSVDQLKQLFA